MELLTTGTLVRLENASNTSAEINQQKRMSSYFSLENTSFFDKGQINTISDLKTSNKDLTSKILKEGLCEIKHQFSNLGNRTQCTKSRPLFKPYTLFHKGN